MSSSGAQRGVELAYAETPTAYSTASAAGPAYEDITGLAIAFTVGLRPVVVRAGGSMFTGGTAGQRSRILIADSANNIKAFTQATIVAASEHHPFATFQFRLPANAGAQSLKLRVGVFTGTGLTSVFAGADSPIWIQALEV